MGETAARQFGLPVPGPVVGMVLLFLLLETGAARGLLVREQVAASGLGAVSAFLLANLGLLFVPAGAGVVQNLDLLGSHALAFGTILVVSTVLSMLATVGMFRAVRRWVQHES